MITSTGRFPEDNYLVDGPRPARKVPPEAVSTPVHQHHLPEGQTQGQPRDNDVSDSALDQLELAPSRRPASDALLAPLASAILGSRGFRTEGSNIIRESGTSSQPSPSHSRGAGRTGDVSEDSVIVVGGVKGSAGVDLGKNGKTSSKQSLWDAPEMKRQSALHTFSRARSFAPSPAAAGAPQLLPDAGPSSSRVPLRKSLTAAAVFGRGREGSAGPSRLTPAADLVPACATEKATTDVFKEKRFRVRGEARSEKVREAIEGAGGIWIEGGHGAWGEDEDELEGERCDYIIVRLVRCVGLSRFTACCSLRFGFETDAVVFVVAVVAPSSALNLLPPTAYATEPNVGLKPVSRNSGYVNRKNMWRLLPCPLQAR